MAPNLWFKTPINAIQGLTTHPVNALHIVREDIQILGKGFGFCANTIFGVNLNTFKEILYGPQ